MDRIEAMQLFTRVVERRSFTAAASDLGIPRSTATEVIKQLEARLGVRLLNRTTRLVTATLEGQAYHARCLGILAEIEDAEGGFQKSTPSGHLRVDASGTLTRTFLVPELTSFLERYPKIQLHLGQGERLVDLVREGIDCVLRAGEPNERGLIMKRLAVIEEITCASPAYLKRRGMPKSPADLERHEAIGFLSSRTNEIMPLELLEGGRTRTLAVSNRLTVNSADTAADLARAGLGLIQAPRYRFERDLADGTLVEVLAKYRPKPTPLVALYPQNRTLAPRVRVFIDWVTQIFREARL